MTLDEFVTRYDGKFVDWDSAFGAQCVDLYRQYVNDVLEFPQSPGVSGANEIWDTVSDEYWEKYTKNPRKGDVVIWNTNLGPYGHVAIYLAGDENNFTSFDQNFPIGSACHKQNHNYKNIIGYLRPRKEDMGFSDEHMRGVLENGFRQMRQTLLGKVDEKGLKADADARLAQTKTGNLDPVKDQFNDYMKASDLKWIKKTDCPKCPPDLSLNLAESKRREKDNWDNFIKVQDERDDCQVKLDDCKVDCQQKYEGYILPTDCPLPIKVEVCNGQELGFWEYLGLAFRSLGKRKI